MCIHSFIQLNAMQFLYSSFLRDLLLLQFCTASFASNVPRSSRVWWHTLLLFTINHNLWCSTRMERAMRDENWRRWRAKWRLWYIAEPWTNTFIEFPLLGSHLLSLLRWSSSCHRGHAQLPNWPLVRSSNHHSWLAERRPARKRLTISRQSDVNWGWDTVGHKEIY